MAHLCSKRGKFTGFPQEKNFPIPPTTILDFPQNCGKMNWFLEFSLWKSARTKCMWIVTTENRLDFLQCFHGKEVAQTCPKKQLSFIEWDITSTYQNWTKWGHLGELSNNALIAPSFVTLEHCLEWEI